MHGPAIWDFQFRPRLYCTKYCTMQYSTCAHGIYVLRMLGCPQLNRFANHDGGVPAYIKTCRPEPLWDSRCAGHDTELPIPADQLGLGLHMAAPVPPPPAPSVFNAQGASSLHALWRRENA